jgi:thymidylate kinase
VRPLVIAIGGMDRAGKTLQRRFVLELLTEHGQAPTCRWTRAGYTRHLESAKRWLNRLRGRKPQRDPADAEPSGRYPRRAEHLGPRWRRWLWTRVAILDLLWIYGVEARRLRRAGHAVVFDRGLEDARVDFRVNFPDDRVERSLLWRLLERFAVRPDAYFLLLVPVAESMRRAAASGRRRRELPEVLALLLEAYRRIAEGGAAEAIDGCQPPDDVTQAMRARVEALLASSLPGGHAAPGPGHRRSDARVAHPLPLLMLCLLL